MKIFIKKILCEILVLITILIALCTAIEYIYVKRINWNITEECSIVVLGNSHSECGINQDQLKRTVNLSKSSHSYFENYYKLRGLHRQSEITKVILEIGPMDLDLGTQDRWITSKPILKGNLSDYSGMIGIKDYVEMLDYISVSDLIIDKLKGLSRSLTGILHTRDYKYFGSSRRLDVRGNLDSLCNVISTRQDIIKGELAEYNLSKLDQIVEYCSLNEIQLIFITCPVYECYNGLFDKDYNYLIKTRYASIEHLDFSNLPIDASCFADIGHLNKEGQGVFTDLLVKNGVLY